MIAGVIGAAREHCEEFLARSLAPCVLEIALDAWPTTRDIAGLAIELPRGPVREVLSILAGEPNSSSDALLDPADYVLDTYGLLARVFPFAGSWPGAVTVPGGVSAIRVQYSAGYAAPDEVLAVSSSSSSSDSDFVPGPPLPKAYRAAMLLMIGHLWENREAVNVGNIVTELPLGVTALLRPTRVRLGMA